MCISISKEENEEQGYLLWENTNILSWGPPHTSLQIQSSLQLLYLLTNELGASPYEGQKLEVIQSPHTLASSWLHSVRPLQLPHHYQIPEKTHTHVSQRRAAAGCRFDSFTTTGTCGNIQARGGACRVAGGGTWRINSAVDRSVLLFTARPHGVGLITRRSGTSSCFRVDVFVFIVYGSSSSSWDLCVLPVSRPVSRVRNLVNTSTRSLGSFHTLSCCLLTWTHSDMLHTCYQEADPEHVQRHWLRHLFSHREPAEHVRNMSGTCQEHVRNMWGTCEEHVRNMSGTVPDTSLCLKAALYNWRRLNKQQLTC